MFGAAAATGPAKIAEMAGITTNPLESGTRLGGADLLTDGFGIPRAAGGAKRTIGWWEKRQLARNAALKLLDPEWLRDKRRHEAKYINHLDLDIAAFQSVSLAGKVAMQRERNFQQQLAYEENSIARNLQEKLWNAGFDPSFNDD